METTMGYKLNKRTDMTMEEWAKRINVGCLYSEHDEDYNLRQFLKRKEEHEHALFLKEREEEQARKDAIYEAQFKRRVSEPEVDQGPRYSVANTIKNFFYKILK